MEINKYKYLGMVITDYNFLVPLDYENKDGDKIIYKDKIFCTDQTINQANNNYYTVNSGVYTTENSFDDDYITI